eukprot:m.7696 g.7696  ORF g.7696 m.7696 type:complete len:211 (-) comp3757_c0_seq1:182-814(-)
MSWFAPKPTQKEIVRQQKKDLRGSGRQLDREYRDLERQEQKLEAEIKACAKKNDKKSATILAKQLIRMRQQKERLLVSKAQLKGVELSATTMGAQVAVAGAMKTASSAMGQMNQQLDLPKLQQTMGQFERESTKMEMSQEMMDDTLDAMFDEDDEEETDLVVSSVLDELGLETGEKLSGVNAPTARPEVPEQTTADDDLMKRLNALTTPQ